MEGDAARLAAGGSQKLAQLSVLLGGLWAARQGREELVAAALVALHACERGRDYDVSQGQLQLPPAGADGQGMPDLLQRLIEAKEGLAFAGHREVLARLSVPQYFRRYLRLAGTCADARGLEGEFWSVYGLRSERAGWAGGAVTGTARVFAASADRRAALLESVRTRAASGDAVVVAVRSAAEAGAIAGALGQAGLRFGVLRGAGGEEELAILQGLDQPGAIALSLYPAQRGAMRAASPGAPLHLAVADLHEARRHVAQVARAYAASSCEQFVALEDEGVAARAGWLSLRRARAGMRGIELAPAAAARFAAAAQRGLEDAAGRQRRELRAREQAQEDLLAFSGRAE
jgi:preprotein translocase subunit SecA